MVEFDKEDRKLIDVKKTTEQRELGLEFDSFEDWSALSELSLPYCFRLFFSQYLVKSGIKRLNHAFFAEIERCEIIEWERGVEVGKNGVD